jgi:uncharacterized caspase-like protein
MQTQHIPFLHSAYKTFKGNHCLLTKLWTQLFRSFLLCMLVSSAGCTTHTEPIPNLSPEQLRPTVEPGNEFLVVDCLLPGQIRRLGQQVTYVTARRPIRTTTEDCVIRGGEYVAQDRADYQTSLNVWLGPAEGGDTQAQYYVGTLYEKGATGNPDFKNAATWYHRSAEQGYSRAAIQLGRLYEKGLGVEKNPAEAFNWYRRASGLESSDISTLLPDSVAATETKASPPSANTPITPTQEAPIIELLDPLLRKTRGVRIELGRFPIISEVGAQREIRGRVISSMSLESLNLNSKSIKLEENGLFRAQLPQLNTGKDKISVDIVAMNVHKQKTTMKLMVVPPHILETPPPASNSFKGFGTYHALVIGNDHYQHWPTLENAISDAVAVAEVLGNRYGFQVTLLKDATRSTILKTLNHYRQTMTRNDNLLIYYAGHGFLEYQIDRGYWIPVDGENKDNSNWILLPSITDLLQLIPAKHVLIVADSCYSGKLTRTALGKLRPDLDQDTRLEMLQTFAHARVRTALTSGGVAPVLDIGKGGHSVFANAFLGVLRENEDILETERLFWAVKARVIDAAKALQTDQVPTYSPIEFAGHEALGDFVFNPQPL